MGRGHVERRVRALVRTWLPPEPTPQRNEPAEALIAKREQYEALAQQFCKPCPVRAECLELALREEAQLFRTWLHSVRGGTAPWQRLNLIVQRRRATKRLATPRR
ncbi:WhiB family transcriptional regulator [Microbispora rosea]|uniref:WhiB family transcriptional regulator n=1 Tax=Microbispora rosea TaxID=58117 RepID=UPI0037B922E5